MNEPKPLASVPLVLVADPASAHSSLPGIEGFYVGIIHPFSTPPQALLMIGLRLLAGGFKPAHARFLLVSFFVTSLAGLIFAIGFAEIDSMMFAMAFLACSTAALFPGKPTLLATLVIGLGAFLIGDASVPDDGPSQDRVFTMSGSMIGANLGLLYLVGICFLVGKHFTRPWVGISFRVIAAWLGAVSLLMLALSFSSTNLTTQ
ncbi:hypothetical protein [Ruegeria sp. HKCCE4148]|uniref:hypothetical protein n=1 Tax=Ruegeria sp. HKCCE4148 TaxID=2794829 RepID=UPI001AE5484B|nr:hypothetical protein [Ruegeria sp. HKCCE4148]